MKKANKLFMIAAVLLCVVMLVSGCSSSQSPSAQAGESSENSNGSAQASSGEKPTIRFAHGWSVGDGAGQIGADAIDAFAEEHKDEFNLVQEVVVGDEMKSKIRIDIAGNNIPDAWMYWGSASDSGSFVKSGILQDMDEYLSLSEQTDYEDYPEGSWDGFRIDGKVWGIPLQGYVGFWFCNKELFDQYDLEYPTTYEELLAVSKVFNDNGIVPLAMGSKAGNPGHFFMSELYAQYENGIQELRDMSTTWKFDTDNIYTVCNLISDMQENGVFPSDTIANGDWGPSFALYNDGRAAMIYTMTWMLGSLEPDTMEVTEIITAPKMPGGTVDPSTFVSRGCSYGLLMYNKSFQDPTKQDALVAIGDLISSDAFVEEQLYSAAQVPGKEIEIDASKLEIPMMAEVLEFAEGKDNVTNHWLNFPATKPWADAQNYLDELFAGSLSAEDYIQKVQDSLDTVKTEETE